MNAVAVNTVMEKMLVRIADMGNFVDIITSRAETGCITAVAAIVIAAVTTAAHTTGMTWEGWGKGVL